MPQNPLRNPTLTFLISSSFFGLFLAIMLAFNPPIAQESFLFRKLMIGSIFGLICISGILAALFPKHCSGMFEFWKAEKHGHPNVKNFASHGTSFTLNGHHPDCEGFSAHVFRLNNRTFCTACTGLFLGGVIALIGTALYFFGGLHVEEGSSLLVWVGVLGAGFGLFQFKVKTSFVRLFLNVFFVLGAFLALVGIDELAQNVFADLFLVSLSVLWLSTRISLSHWDHKRICYACNEDACKFRRSRLISRAKTVESTNKN